MPKDVYVRFECGQEDRISKEYGPFPFAQLTYETLRVGPDGEHLAVWLDELQEWIPLPENPHYMGNTAFAGPKVWYSDVVIYAEAAHA